MSVAAAAAWTLLRPLLFSLDAERAHALGLRSLGWSRGAWQLLGCRRIDDPVELMGIRFPNRVGLAAGLDKNGRHVDDLAALGFGFIEVGTVTPLAQPGNPAPRMFRLPRHQALINRMGFNNEGLDSFLANVARARPGIVLGLNIGKNAATPIDRAVEDYLACLTAVYPHASYVAVNISSPNTRDLRSLQQGEALDAMLRSLMARRSELALQAGRVVPLLVKIAPDLDEAGVEQVADSITRHAVDGVIATNTTIDRSAITGDPHAGEAGGLSGRPVAARSNAVIRGLRRSLATQVPIIGVGGIMGADDARAKFDAGADLVQLYTGLIYRGPALITECARAARAHFSGAR